VGYASSDARRIEQELLAVVTQMIASNAAVWDELGLSPVVNPISRSGNEARWPGQPRHRGRRRRQWRHRDDLLGDLDAEDDDNGVTDDDSDGGR
jgi:hypothetical protein